VGRVGRGGQDRAERWSRVRQDPATRVPADQGSDVRTGRATDWPIDGAIMTVEEAVEVTGRTPHPIHVIDRHVGVLIYEDGGSWDARRGPMAAARRRLTLT
jgi:hypothetical protein